MIHYITAPSTQNSIFLFTYDTIKDLGIKTQQRDVYIGGFASVDSFSVVIRLR
jgi:hypothetical protein